MKRSEPERTRLFSLSTREVVRDGCSAYSCSTSIQYATLRKGAVCLFGRGHIYIPWGTRVLYSSGMCMGITPSSTCPTEHARAALSAIISICDAGCKGICSACGRVYALGCPVRVVIAIPRRQGCPFFRGQQMLLTDMAAFFRFSSSSTDILRLTVFVFGTSAYKSIGRRGLREQMSSKSCFGRHEISIFSYLLMRG